MKNALGQNLQYLKISTAQFTTFLRSESTLSLRDFRNLDCCLRHKMEIIVYLQHTDKTSPERTILVGNFARFHVNLESRLPFQKYTTANF